MRTPVTRNLLLAVAVCVILTAAAAVAWATTSTIQPAHQRITITDQTPGGNQ